MKYIVNDDCIGCGICVNNCPEVFSMTDEGVAVAIDEEVPETSLEKADKAMDSCPMQAISKED